MANFRDRFGGGGPRRNVTYSHLHHPLPCARACSGLTPGARHSNRHQHEITEAVRGGGAQSVPVTALEPHVSRGEGEYWCGAGTQGPVSGEPTTTRRVCTTLQKERRNGCGMGGSDGKRSCTRSGKTRNETLGCWSCARVALSHAPHRPPLCAYVTTAGSLFRYIPGF